MIPTADPYIFIEEIREGYVRYRNLNGRRWEIHGICDRRGDCMIGAVVDGVTIRDHAHLFELAGEGCIDSGLDVPVSVEFCGVNGICCGSDGTLTARMLPSVLGTEVSS